MLIDAVTEWANDTFSIHFLKERNVTTPSVTTPSATGHREATVVNPAVRGMAVCLATTAVSCTGMGPARPSPQRIEYSSAEDLERMTCVAVLPLTNHTSLADVGDLAVREFAQELTGAGLLVMDPTDTVRVLAHHDIYLPLEGLDADRATVLTSLLGVQGLIYGVVAEGASRGATAATMSANVEMFHNGQTVWATNATLDVKGSAHELTYERLIASVAQSIRTDFERAQGGITPIPVEPCWQTAVASLGHSNAAQGGDAQKSAPAEIEKATLTDAQTQLLARLTHPMELTGFAFDILTGKLTGEISELQSIGALLAARPALQIVLDSYVDPRDKEALAESGRRAEIVRQLILAYGGTQSQIALSPHGGENPRRDSITELTREGNRRLIVRAVDQKAVGRERPRLKLAAAVGAERRALDLFKQLRDNKEFSVVRPLIQTEEKRATTVYCRSGMQESAQRVARSMHMSVKVEPTSDLPPGVDIYVIVGGEKQ